MAPCSFTRQRITRAAEMHWEMTVAQCHARHIHLHDDDEEQIQDDIDDAGEEEIEQRPLGVAHGPQQRCAEVIEHGGGHTGKVDAQIQCG